MAVQPSARRRPTPRVVADRLGGWARFGARYATADLRALPDFVVIGTQRGGTTSLYRWLATHPDVTPASKKEVHYFDDHYDHPLRWYRAHFPVRRPGLVTGEASPYMLFHPLAPERAARELPETTRFVALLREPVQRALSQYWYWRQLERANLGVWETEEIDRAFELEPARMAAAEPAVLAGRRSVEHVAYSYVARGEYAPQLRRWFDAVGCERVLVLESERLYVDRATSERVLSWLGLPPNPDPYPVVNGAERPAEGTPELVDRLRAHFAPWNEELFSLLGRRLWEGDPTGEPTAPSVG